MTLGDGSWPAESSCSSYWFASGPDGRKPGPPVSDVDVYGASVLSGRGGTSCSAATGCPARIGDGLLFSPCS